MSRTFQVLVYPLGVSSGQVKSSSSSAPAPEFKEVIIDSDASIEDLKIAIDTELDPESVTLSDETGRIWLDCFDVSDIPDDLTLHIISRKPVVEIKDETLEMMKNARDALKNNPRLLQEMQENPVVQNLLNDPEKLKDLVKRNPGMQKLPGVQRLLEDPELITKAQAIANDPERLEKALHFTPSLTDGAWWYLRPHPQIARSCHRILCT